MFLNSGIDTRSYVCAIEKWYSQRPPLLSISLHFCLVFVFIFRLPYLSSAMLVPITVNHSHLQLHNFLPCSTPDLQKLLWNSRAPVILISWLSRVAICQALSISHSNHTLFFYTKHRVSRKEKLFLDFATYTEMT